MKNRLIITILVLSILLCGMTVSASASSNTSYVVIEESTGRILDEYNKDVSLPIASTTKIVTAIVALEHANLTDEVVIPKEAEGVEGSSIYIKAGEVYTVEDLLYGLMLRSGNDAATALALHVSGSIEEFCKLMNDKARYLGANNTNFTNPHGLHDDNHYSSAYDMAILTASAFKNEVFSKIVSSKSYKLKDSYIYNKNKLLNSYEGADGVKTGYTTKSGRCLVSSSTRDGMRVICVVLNCYDMWDKSKSLMDKAHENYSMVKVASSLDKVETKVYKGVSDRVNATISKDLYYPLKDGEKGKVNYNCEVYELLAPVYTGTECGKLEVYLDNHLIFSENIYTINNVAKKSLLDWLRCDRMEKECA